VSGSSPLIGRTHHTHTKEARWHANGAIVSSGLTEDTVCVGVARLGSAHQAIRTATLSQLASCDLGAPLHSLVVTGRLHPLEVEMLRLNAEPNALQHLMDQ